MKKLLLFLTLFTTPFIFAYSGDPVKKLTEFTIVLDSGHGGKDFGSVFENFSEKEITHSVVLKIKELALKNNINVKLTRETDYFVSLEDRVSLINETQPAVTVSIHLNSINNTDASGAECFIGKNINPEDSISKLGNDILDEFDKTFNLKNRGVKNAQLYLLNFSKTPILNIHLGFLSNENDRKILISEENQNKIAEIIFNKISQLR